MKKIKVGYLPLYIKLYDDSNPHYRDPMVDYMHMLIKMLESQGLGRSGGRGLPHQAGIRPGCEEVQRRRRLRRHHAASGLLPFPGVH